MKSGLGNNWHENPNFDNFNVHWYGVEGYYENEKSKEKFIENEVILEIKEITSLKTISMDTSKEDTFLRIIHRDLPANFKPQLRKTMTVPMFKETSKYESPNKHVILESLKHTPSVKQTLKKVLEKINYVTLSTTEEVPSFDSFELDYHNLSLINRNSEIVSTMDDGLCSLDENRVLRSSHLSRMLKSFVPDMAETISAETLISFFVKEYYLKNTLSSEFELNYKHMYESVIKKDNIVYKLLKKRKNMLPKDLINLIHNENKSKSVTEVNALKDDIGDRDLFFYTSLSCNFNNIMKEISQDILELSNFYFPLFQVTFEIVKPIKFLVECDNEDILRKEITQMNLELKMNKEEPGSLTRWKTMELVCSAENNNLLAVLMANHCGYWLNNLLKCLFSPFSSVREESSLVLAYIITRPVLMEELLRSKQYDVTYDMVVVLLRAIEQFPENISSFYCIIGFIFQRSWSVEIIDYILEIGPNLNNDFLKKKWPRIVYFALRYWPTIFMSEKPALLRKIIDLFQQMILKNKAKKMSKLALYFLCRKFSMYPTLVTVWYDTNPGKKFS